MIYDKDIGMWHKRNTSHYLIKDCYKNKYFFDNEGRVENNYQYNKVKKDVVIIGDSQIEGLSVDNRSVIHNSLYQELNGKYNVLNYALAGTGPVQQLEILKHKVNINKIDTLFQFVILENDLNDGDQATLNGVNRPKVYAIFESLDKYKVIKPKPYDYQEKSRDFIGNFELYVYLKRTFNHYKRILLNLSTSTSLAPIKVIRPPLIVNEEYKWQQLKGAIYQTNKLAKKYRFKYVVIFLSSFEKLGYAQNSSKFEKFLKRHHVDSVNILPYLNTLESDRSLSYTCDGHWNKYTHSELAKYIGKNFDL